MFVLVIYLFQMTPCKICFPFAFYNNYVLNGPFYVGLGITKISRRI